MWASKRTGESKKGMTGRASSAGGSTKKHKTGEDELHDFIHDIEYSAKKILKEHMKKKVKEAARDKMLEQRNRIHGGTTNSPLRGGDSIGYSTLGQSGAMPSPGSPGGSTWGPATEEPGMRHTLSSTASTTQFPKIAGGSNSGGMMGASMTMSSTMMASSSSLPSVHQNSIDRTSMALSKRREKRELTDRDRTKLMKSPFMETWSKQNAGVNFMEKEDEDQTAKMMKKELAEAGKSGRQVLREAAALAGATIKGDVHALAMLRADHGVDRRMSAQKWADPNQTTGVEGGMRNLGLILDREHELQGPTGWSSDDLRRKYRDELEREAAYKAGQESVEEAARLEREQNIIRAVVTIPPHPLFAQFVNLCMSENERSKRRARARNQLKAYSLDLITIWHANRPKHEGSDDPKFARFKRGVKGIKDRRPAHAVKAFNAQVQSVSINRAMASSVSSSQLKGGGGGVRSSAEGEEDGNEGETVTLTLAEKDADEEERAKNRRAMWARPWFRGSGKIPKLDAPLETAAEQINCMWPTTPAAKKAKEIADVTLSIFKRGMGAKKRLVLHVHEHETSAASTVQLDDSKIDFLLQKMAQQKVLNEHADRKAVVSKKDADIAHRRSEVRAKWTKRVEDKAAAMTALTERRKTEFEAAAKAEFVQADRFVTKLDGRYIVMTITVSTSSHAPRPDASIVQFSAYDPLSTERAEVQLSGWQLFRLLSQPPRCGSEEEKTQWDEFRDLDLYFCDPFDEDIRLRTVPVDRLKGYSKEERVKHSRWDGPVAGHFQSLGKYEPDNSKLSMMERMQMAKTVNAWWTNWAERRTYLWHKCVPKFHWESEVQVKHAVADRDKVKVVHLRFDLPESVSVARHKAEEKEYQTCMEAFQQEHNDIIAVVQKDEETKKEQLARAVELALKKEKGKMILKMICLVPGPELPEGEEAAPGAPVGQEGQLVVALPGGEGQRIGEAQSSVRGRDEAEEWAAAEEAAREEERLALAESTLSYIVSGAHEGFGKTPGTGIYGLMDIVTGIFRRDPELSSTNMVLVTLATSLETPLLCPMLGGYDTIVEQAPPAPEENVGGPISAVVAPVSIRQVRSEMNTRLPDTIVAFCSDVKALDHHFEGHRNRDGSQTKYSGHRRNDPERHADKGFLYWSKQDVSFSDPIIIPKAYGVTQTAAVPNAPGCWPRRHTWHSEDLAGGILAKPRVAIDYAYVSSRKVGSGSNDPNIYISRMDTYKLGQLEMRKLSLWLRQEREKAEKEKKDAEKAALQERIDAGKAMAKKRTEQREALERSERMAKLREARRMKGKGRGAGDDPKTWKERRDRSTIVGISLAAGSGDWVAYMDPETGQQDTGGTIFYHSEALERETGNGSQWDRPPLWAGVIGGDDMAAAIKDAEPRLRAMGLLEFSNLPDAVNELREETPRTREARLDRERHEKLVKDRAIRMEEKEREKREHMIKVRSRLRRFLDERAKINDTKYDLRKPFNDFDTNGDGQISMEEFKNTMELLFVGEAVEFYPDELQTIAAQFDRNGDGYITFAEFCAYAFGESTEMDGILFVDMGTEDSQRVLDLLAEVDAYTELIDDASGKKYWYHTVSAQSVFDEPPDVIASVKALEAEKALFEQHRSLLKAKEEMEHTKAALSKHSDALPTSMAGFVDKLSENKNFVEQLAERLGLNKNGAGSPQAQRQGEGSDRDSDEEGEAWELETDSEEEDRADEDEDPEVRRNKLRRPRKIHNKHEELMRRRLAWRRMKPVKMKQNFVTAATSTNVATAPPGLCICNRPSVVGVVDPSQGTTHEVWEDSVPVKTEVVEDIMADAERLGAQAAGGDAQAGGGEAEMTAQEEMLENTHKIFSFVRNAEYDGVDAMLDEGVDVNSPDDNGNTPLLVAAQQGLKKIAKLLLRRGANINQTNLAGNTVLHYCFAYSFEELGEYFIKKGADDSVVNAEGLTCYEGLSQESVGNI